MGNDFALNDISFTQIGGMGLHTFAYDYRSRRYYRSTPTTPHMYCVFDGGLSIQEYETTTINEQLSTINLQTEFVRGEGMGGGVGGMVYSIKADSSEPTADSIIFSHANHRGDVIGRSDENRSLTSFALYEAYGTRPYEWGDDPDRHKANTKEEESDLGLLNEGMRFRDLETGVFLTRDPIGYGDGPNVYCYVHCNPITQFDAWGLNVSSTTTENEDGTTETEYEIEAEVVFDDDRLNEQNDDGTYKYQDERDEYVQSIKDGMMETYNGKEGNHSWSLSADNLKISVASSASDVKENNHMIIVTSAEKMPGGSTQAAVAERGGGAMWLNTSKFSERTAAHESVHWFGMKDNQGDAGRPDNQGVDGNITFQSNGVGGNSSELTPSIVKQIDKYDNQQGAINNGLGPRDQTDTLKSDRELNLNFKALKAAEPKPRRYLPGY